jgi:hypothetical protein
MIRIGHMFGVALLFSFAGSATAAPLTYTCDVLHIYDLSEKGALNVSAFEKEMKGGSFSVSRVTGEIVGEVVSTILAKSTRVLNNGSTKNSFKAAADFEEQFQVLEVQEFRPGSVKPFVASSMGSAGIVTGTCK